MTLAKRWNGAKHGRDRRVTHPGPDGEWMNEVRLIQVNAGDCFMPGIRVLTAHTSSGESAH